MTDRPVLAVDLGGTKIRAGIVFPPGRVEASVRRSTPGGADRVVEEIVRMGEEAMHAQGLSRGDLAGAGMGTAGVVARQSGRVVYAPNLPFEGVALGDALEQELGLPWLVDNDGRLAAWGEYRFGRHAGEDPLVCLFLGTGIGIGMVVDARLVRGAGNAAGEVGHTILAPEGPACNCGKRGCFEAVAGGANLLARARGVVEGIGPQSTVGDLVRRAAAGDAAADRLLEEALRALSILTANLVTLLNPRAVVVGGGVLKGWPDLLDAIRARLPALCHARVLQDLSLDRGALGGEAILLGAAAAVWEAARAGGR